MHLCIYALKTSENFFKISTIKFKNMHYEKNYTHIRGWIH